MARVISDAAREGVEVPGLAVRLVALAPGSRTALSGDGETMAYAVHGGGVTTLGPIAPESLVWLDPGEALEIEAGPDGLQLLVAHAPAG